MVSRRTASPLRARLLLAQRRRADVEGRRAYRRRIEELRAWREGCEGVARTHFQSRWRGSEISDSSLRGRLLLHVEGTPFPVKRHAREVQPERQAGTRSHRTDFSAGPWGSC